MRKNAPRLCVERARSDSLPPNPATPLALSVPTGLRRCSSTAHWAACRAKARRYKEGIDRLRREKNLQARVGVVHALEAECDVSQRQPVGDERLDVDRPPREQ